MSGGSHGYVYCRIEDELVGKMYDDELNDLAADIAELAHDLEWYDSGDICEEKYRETIARFKKKWFMGTGRNERLKGYVDKNIAEMRERLYRLVGADEDILNGKESDAFDNGKGGGF